MARVLSLAEAVGYWEPIYRELGDEKGYRLAYDLGVVYQELGDVNCVLHTHSPWATAFAVANRSIECWSEAMAIFGLGGGVPVAAYGPRERSPGMLPE